MVGDTNLPPTKHTSVKFGDFAAQYRHHSPNKTRSNLATLLLLMPSVRLLTSPSQKLKKKTWKGLYFFQKTAFIRAYIFWAGYEWCG